MAKVHGTWIREVLDTWKVCETTDFIGEIRYGIENFNCRKVYYYLVYSKMGGSIHTGDGLYTEYGDCVPLVIDLCNKEQEKWEKEIVELRKLYRVE